MNGADEHTRALIEALMRQRDAALNDAANALAALAVSRAQVQQLQAQLEQK